MKKLLIILMLLFSTTAIADILVEYSGPIKIKSPKGKRLKPVIGLDLEIGSVIYAKKDGKVLLMDDNGVFNEIKAPQKYTTGKPQVVTKDKTVIQGIAMAMREASTTDSGPTVYGMVKRGAKSGVIRPSKPGPFHGTYPVVTAIEKPMPITFKWTVDKNREDMNIIIENSKKKALIIKPVNFSSGQIQIGPRPFHAGKKFYWRFALKVEGKKKLMGASVRYPFTILTKAKLKSLNKDILKIKELVEQPDARKLLLGQLYYGYGLFNEATLQLTPLYEKNPTPFLDKLLTLSFYRQRLVNEADAMGLNKQEKKK